MHSACPGKLFMLCVLVMKLPVCNIKLLLLWQTCDCCHGCIMIAQIQILLVIATRNAWNLVCFTWKVPACILPESWSGISGNLLSKPRIGRTWMLELYKLEVRLCVGKYCGKSSGVLKLRLLKPCALNQHCSWTCTCAPIPVSCRTLCVLPDLH